LEIEMKLSILFGQRECNYPGELAPEAIRVADCYTMEENPDWIKEELRKAESWNEYESLEIVTIDIGSAGQQTVHDRLNGNAPAIVGQVV
jgi:hypothetical protein